MRGNFYAAIHVSSTKEKQTATLHFLYHVDFLKFCFLLTSSNTPISCSCSKQSHLMQAVSMSFSMDQWTFGNWVVAFLLLKYALFGEKKKRVHFLDLVLIWLNALVYYDLSVHKHFFFSLCFVIWRATLMKLHMCECFSLVSLTASTVTYW